MRKKQIDVNLIVVTLWLLSSGVSVFRGGCSSIGRASGRDPEGSEIETHHPPLNTFFG